MRETATSPTPETELLLPAYAEWLERVDMTRESIAYCCFHRLNRDRPAAERVSITVIAGLLARPRVFQYFGLPFSGRVAHLAEQGIAEALRGVQRRQCSWATLRTELVRLTPAEQEVVVLTCVEGHDNAQLAAALHCDETTAQERREHALARLRRCAELAAPASPRQPGQGGRDG